jgi:acetoin utilization protein AcuB
MSVSQLILAALPTLDPTDSGIRALEVMDETNLIQLPVVAGDEYMALISENDLLDWPNSGDQLSTAHFLNFKPAISSSGHPFEAMRVMHDMKLSVLPVLDEDRKYIGCITKDDLLKYMAESSGIDSPGGIVVLEILPRNYTLYEIARICENEDVIILNMQVHTNEQGLLEVTLKLNRTIVDPVVSSFERHNYKVKEVYGDDSDGEDIEGKYNLLMNYINM